MGLYQGVCTLVLKAIKITALFVIKYLGGFWLARKLNKGNTCVLCYHGFAYQDEFDFRPKLFMRPSTYARRMQWLVDSPYKIVSLQNAVTQQHNENKVVLTMDDGWAATYELVNETLTQHKLPIMLYVTSYYADKQGAVINVALAYLLWKSIGKRLIIDDARLSLNQEYEISSEKVKDIVNDICQAMASVEFSVRQEILLLIAKQLEQTLHVDGQLMFRALNEQEIALLQDNNIDIQLHSHRHCSPQNEQQFKLEIQQNIDYLQRVTEKEKLTHFCYPSGEYYLGQLPWLRDSNVRTATTVFAGMLTPDTDNLQIPRFLDGEDVHQLEFEAALCGLASLIGKLRK